MGGSTQKKQFYNDFQKLIFGIKRVKGKKSASPLKWFVVATSLIMVLSVVYSYDTPAALKRSLYSHVKSDDFETQFAWLYSYYSLPNIVLPLIAGYLMDKFGLNTILLIFGVFAISGQLLFAYGVSEQSWWFMSVGRFFLGFGGETLKISNFALLPEWFNPIDLGLSNGIVALSRLGSLLTFLISPNLIARWSFSITLLPIIIFALLALIALIALQYFQCRVGQQIANNEIQAYELISNPISRQSSGDREERGVSETENDDDLEDDDDDEEEETSISEIDTILNTINDEETDDEGGKHRQTKKKGGSQNTRNRNTIMRSSNSRDQLTSPRSRSSTPTTTSSSSSSSSSTSYSSSSAFAFSSILKLELKFWLLALSYSLIIISFGPFQNLSFSILLERDTFKPIPSTCTLARTNACQSDSNPPSSLSCPKGKEYQLPLPGYYESYNPLLASDVDCSLPSWKDVCTEKYCDRFNNAEIITSFMIIIQFFVYLFAAGPFQRVADDAMARLIWLGNAILLLFFTHLFFAVTRIPAWILMIGQGLATTLFNLTFWSLLGYTVDRKVYGTAFGILQSLQHIVYTIVPLILADVYHQSGDRYIPQVEYVFVVASVLALLPLFALYLFRNALNMQL